MKNTIPILIGASLSLAAPNIQAIAHPSSAYQEARQPTWPDYQKICEGQSLIIMQELMPLMKKRVVDALNRGLDSLEVKVEPDPNWPAQYVQTQVAYYLSGKIEKVELGKFSLSFPVPFLDFSLRYWQNGKHELNAVCKNPDK